MSIIAFPNRSGLETVNYQPNARNGEVYVTPFHNWATVDGHAVETFAGFAWVHMAANGDSATVGEIFEVIDDARDAAKARAISHNAVLT